MDRTTDAESGTPISRRGFLGAAGGLVAGGALAGGAIVVAADERGSNSSPSASSTLTEAFYGTHQGGVTTPPQSHSSFVALDVNTEKRAELAVLFQRWTAIAANLTAGRPAAPMTSDPSAVEPDSGETLGLGPARLTINFGFGPALFGVGAPDRLGLRSRWPEPLVNLPSFPGDDLVESRTGGDLTIHACADDPQVAFHAVRQLVRAAKGTASVRWSQAGFNEAAATTGTPRNLTGFKDGTANPTSQFDIEQFIWVGAEDQAWMVGGTYVVTRRIRIALDRWDASALEDQERAIGRSKVTGAPLGRSAEHDSLDLAARNADGTPVMPLDAHVRLASPDDNWGQMMLRRSYSYDDGVDMLAGRHPSQGEVPALDAGLFFVSYQRNPRLAFIPMFDKLSRHDALRHFTIHTGSAIAAIPPAASAPGDWVGRELLES